MSGLLLTVLAPGAASVLSSAAMVAQWRRTRTGSVEGLSGFGVSWAGAAAATGLIHAIGVGAVLGIIANVAAGGARAVVAISARRAGTQLNYKLIGIVVLAAVAALTIGAEAAGAITAILNTLQFLPQAAHVLNAAKSDTNVSGVSATWLLLAGTASVAWALYWLGIGSPTMTISSAVTSATAFYTGGNVLRLQRRHQVALTEADVTER